MSSFKYRSLLLLVIIFAAALLRLSFLNTLPHSITGDELHYPLSAKAFFLTGKDITQTKTLLDIFLFSYPHDETIQAELPYLFELLTLGAFPFSLFASALPTAIIGVLMVPLIYVLTKELTNNDTIAFISSAVTAFNPWLLLTSRTSYEMITATFFYLSALYLLLKMKSWKILYALPVLLLAFYSYIATKVILFPFVAVSLLYIYVTRNGKKYMKQYVLLLVIVFLFIEFFLFRQVTSAHTTRLGELIRTSDITVHVVNEQLSTIHNPFTFLFVNNYSLLLKTIIVNTFNIFAPTHLFLLGDNFFLSQKHGFFYIIDLLFLITGVYWLIRNNKKLLTFLSACVLVVILPQILRYQFENFSPHITLLFPFIIIVISIGIWAFFHLFPRNIRLPLIGICLTVYIYLIGNLLHFYIFQNPLFETIYDFSDRVITRYITLAKTNNRQIVIFSQNPERRFRTYLFYGNHYSKTDASKIAFAINTKKYSLANVTFHHCDQIPTSFQNRDIIIVRRECAIPVEYKTNKLFINPFLSHSPIFTLINDPLCQHKELKAYDTRLTLQNFAVEKIDHGQFCKLFIQR